MNESLKEKFAECFGHEAKYFVSAPGRTEIGGNHTDHQHGRVIAAAIDLDTRAAVAENGTDVMRIKSEGYKPIEVDINKTDPVPEERGTSAALARGVAARIISLGREVRGFDAYVTSTVLPGSGLSSSAAFEVMLGTAMNALFDCGLNAVETAQIGQYAENVYFGKPSGLMDQMASSVGGAVYIDFEDTAKPKIEKLDVDLSALGLSLCIIDSGADHADLTDEYAAITAELASLCAFFNKKYLREIPEGEFLANIPELRRTVGDRAVLRAMHVYAENKRVEGETAALKAKDTARFLALVNESGRSSWTLLQNITPTGSKGQQALAVTLALAGKILAGEGAVRVHGGGFAGTVQTFVPTERAESFKAEIEAYLGKDTCHILSIRNEGGKCI